MTGQLNQRSYSQESLQVSVRMADYLLTRMMIIMSNLVYSAGGGGRGFGGFGGPGAQSGSLLLVTEENGYQKNAATLSMADVITENNTLILKLDKKGSIYTASCSSDGKNFKPVGSAEIMLKDIKAGIIVCEGVPDPRFARFLNMPGMPQQQREPETPFEVSYDYFHITNTGLK